MYFQSYACLFPKSNGAYKKIIWVILRTNMRGIVNDIYIVNSVSAVK